MPTEMDSRNTHKNSSKNSNTRFADANQNTTPNTISDKRLPKVNRGSSDKPATVQSNPAKPSDVVTNELTCKLALTHTNNRNYSSRNMLRDSGPTTSSEMARQSETSASHWTHNQERTPCQNPRDYTKLTDDCFIFETQETAICLLCGKNVRESSINQHVDTEQHRKQFNKLDLRLLNENLDESSLQMNTIKALCDKWYLTQSLTDDLARMRNAAISDLEEILGAINPECQLRIHGSSYYGAATRDSDVNLELVHPNSKLFEFDPKSKNSIHHRLIDPDAEYGNQFNHHTMHYDLVSNPVETLYKIYRIVSDSSQSLPSYPFTLALSQLNCKVPNITLKHRASGSTLNVNCYSERRFNLAQLLRTYALLDQRLEQLSTIIKIWAKFCCIDNPDLGSYPPHAYVVMMIYYLQRTEPPVLPCLHELISKYAKTPNQTEDVKIINIQPSDAEVDKINEARDDDPEDEVEDTWMACIDEAFLKDLSWTSANKTPVHVLFTEFLKSMIEEFANTSTVITIRTLKPVVSRFNTQSKAIEHPINTGINISRCLASMKTYDFIRDSFFHSYFYLTSIPIGQNLKALNIIRSDPRDYINLYVNKSRLQSYFSMKEPTIKRAASYDPIEEMTRQRLFDRDVETLHALTKEYQEPSLPQMLANLYDPGLFKPQNITYSYSCQLCRATGHSREKCPKGLIETLHDEYFDSSLDERVNLDAVLMKFFKNETISSDLSLEHNKVLGILKRVINDALDMNLSFVLYGSTVNSLGNRDSDLDICVTVKDNLTGKDIDCIEILKNISNVLETITEVHQIQPVFSAKVPIIRFKFNDFDIDLSMYNQCAIYNSKLLRTYSMINPKFAPLCFLVKRFAKRCGIADASKGSLSSYAWCLLVIYYLQRLDPPILPVLQEPIDSPIRGCFGINGWNVWFNDKPVRPPEHPYSLIQLLKGFYLFYGHFDFEKYVVSIRKKVQITKFQKSWNGCMIAIEDPFELTYNLANRLSDQMAIFILNSFAQTYKHIVRIQNKLDSNSELHLSPSRLAVMLFDGLAITKVGPPVRGCLICHKIGHRVKECPERNKGFRNRGASKKSARKNQNGHFPVGKW